MNPIIRNLISVVRRFKLAAALNILGLSVAFSAFMVIMIQLDYDAGFDKCHQDYDKIYRLEINWGTYWQAIINRPLAERFFESSPYIDVEAVLGVSVSKEEFCRHLRLTVLPDNHYMTSFTLIIGASFMFLQNHFMQYSFVGYNRDGIITVETARLTGNRDAFTNQIKAFAGVDEITYGASLLSWQVR